jgi:malonyl CoA-acyl carrier protein transacylase
LKKLALLFPGQGSQHIGMGKDLCKYFPVANRTFEEASDILHLDLKWLCDEGDIRELTKTENAQPALLTLSAAKYRVYQQELGVTPFLGAGHSLGEYSALTCSNAISFADAVKLVKIRGTLMQEAAQNGAGGMMAVARLGKEIIEEECKKCSNQHQQVVIANYNSPNQLVISGHQEALLKVSKILTDKGGQVLPLNVSAAFHSPLMQKSAELFEKELVKIKFRKPGWPVIANVNALPYQESADIPGLLTKQITHPIQWEATMEYMKRQGIDVAIEFGPKHVLKNLMKKCCKSITVYSTNTHEDLQELYQVEPEDFIDKRPNFLERCLAMAVCTANRNFNEEQFQTGVIEPYREIKEMYHQLTAEKKEPETHHMKKAAALLQEIFSTKKVPVNEQTRRFKRIFAETGTLDLFPGFKVDPVVCLKNPVKESSLRLQDLELDTGAIGLSLEEETDNTGDIAVIGMALRTAFADNVAQFRDNLINGKDCIHEIPDSRQQDIDDYFPYLFRIKLDAAGKRNKKRYMNAAYLKEVDKFDYRFFKISPKEAGLMDPCQRIFLETAFHALEDAGYAGKNAKKYETGVYVGYSDDAKLNYFQMIGQIEPGSIPMAVAGNLSSIVPSRISYFMDLTGPCLLVDTACSSSLVAIHLACQAIRNSDCEQAIAGGVRVNLMPIAHTQSTKVGIESADGKTRTFDDASDGTGVGEGSAAVLLKPLDKALDDRDHIYAIIKGSAVNQDGQSLGITAPKAEAQTRVIVKAWKNANVDPETISYIEAHGTGTRLGDPIEIQAITNAFKQFTNKKQFCAVGSVKTNIGHLFEAAGIFGFIKAVLSLTYGTLPPMLHFNYPHRDIPFEESPVYVNDELVEWKTSGFPLRCGVTAFGFSGTNCHIVLEAPPRIINQKLLRGGLNQWVSGSVGQWVSSMIGKSSCESLTMMPRPHPETNENQHKRFAQHLGSPRRGAPGRRRQNILLLSAKTEEGLFQQVKNYKDFLTLHQDLSLADICYTAAVGRSHFNHRLAIMAVDRDDLLIQLDKISNNQKFLRGGMNQWVSGSVGQWVSSVIGKGSCESPIMIPYHHPETNENKHKRFAQHIGSPCHGAPGRRRLEELCQLYVTGVDVDWEEFYQGMEVRKVSLPLYPFERKRCWLDIPPYEENAASPLEGKLFFNMEWVREALLESESEVDTGLEKHTDSESPGIIMILKGGTGISQQISEAFRKKGRQVVEVTFGNTFNELGNGCYEVGGSEEHYERLLLLLKGKPIETIIFLAALVQGPAVSSLRRLQQSQKRGAYNLFHLTKMILKHYSTEKIEYIVIADYVNNVTGKEKQIKPENAPVFGLAYAIDRECENISTRCIDIDESVTFSQLMAEIKSEKQYRAAAYRDTQRYCERFIPIEIETMEDDPVEIKDTGVYLITGGTGGIGLEVSKYLAAQKPGVRIALVNRTPMPDRSRWEKILEDEEDKRTGNKIKTIREIEARGGHVYLFQGDCSKYRQMKSLVEHLREKFGKINGIIHSAGKEGEGLLVRKNESKFNNVLNSKVAGTWILDHLTRTDNLDFLVLFSTVATFLMNPGQTDYTAANAYLDSYAYYRGRQGKKTLALNWVTWKETGMAVNFNANFDIIFKAIPTAQAIDAFDTVLKKKIRQVLVGELNIYSKLINLLKNAQFQLAAPIAKIIDTPDNPLKSHSTDEQRKKVRKVKLTGKEDGKYSKSELLVAKVWGEVLGFEELRINDNFYELGGDSILATQVVNRINSENNLKLSLIEIFNYETIKDLAGYVESLL